MKIKKEIIVRGLYSFDYFESVIGNILKEVKFPYFAPSFKGSFKNICNLTGKTRWVIKVTKSSRFIFRRLADGNSLEGWRKSTW